MAGVELGEVGVANEQRGGGARGTDVVTLGKGHDCSMSLPWPSMERSRGGNEVAVALREKGKKEFLRKKKNSFVKGILRWNS
jgi:hypothetical protein